MEHMAEQGIHWSMTEGGPWGVAGVVLGAVFGWPRSTSVPIPHTSLHMTVWHSAVGSGSFEKMIVAGMVLCAVLGVAFAAAAATVAQARRSAA